MNAFKRTFALPLICGVLVALLGAPLAAQVQNADDLVYPPLPEVELPSPERVELGNGLVVMLTEDHELPLVNARVLVRAGSRWESPDHVGLASLTGQVMRSGGTQSIASDELDDLLEDRAAVLETSIGTSSGSASMSCLVDDFPDMLRILHDVLRYPAFDESKLEVAKNQLKATIARQNDNPGQILGREFRELIYGSDSPYARGATYETLGNIDRDDLVAFHQRYYHPDRIILGLVGDFDKKKALKLVKEVFSDWPRGPKVEEPAVPYREEPNPGVFFVEKNDVTQSNIRIGHLGLRRDHPDYYSVELMNQVLGGSFAARLFSRVRSEKGLAYNVFGSVTSQWDHPGTFLMSMSTKTETTAAGIEALLLEAHNMTDEPPTAEEVEKARAAILNSFVFSADSLAEILNRQMTYEYYDYPLDWLERYRSGIESVTLEQVRKAAADHIHPDRFSILVVGPKEGVDRPLSEFGEVTPVDITIPEPPAPKQETSAATEARGGELIAKAVEFMGGAEAIAAVEGMDMKSKMELKAPQGSMVVQTHAIIHLPNHVRWEIAAPFGTLVRVYDGEKAFLQTPQGTQPLGESQLKDLKDGLLRLPLILLSHHDAEDFQAFAQGAGEVEGKVVERVYVKLGDVEQTLGIDPETGAILSVEYRGPGLAGTPGDLRQVLSDFREVGDLRLAFASEGTFDGQPMADAEIVSLELNPEVDEALFEMPQ
jgi:predicted Zn-dependent peptidase/outer membrane lipoprotein-sorting protein